MTAAAVGGWASPALLAVVAAAVFAGDPTAALLVLTVALAPLVALLLPPAPPDRHPVGLGLLALSVAGVLGAGLHVLADVARVLGGPAWLAVGAAVVGVLAADLRPALRPWLARATALGVVALLVALGAVGARVALPPWAAWEEVAARPALAFSPDSAWVRAGGAILGPTAVTFTEPHRVTALGDALYRVIERDGDHVAVREWRLSTGEVLRLRPGDRLVLEAGARLRFEPGKRVPGAPPSGPAWADPPERPAVAARVALAGVALTVVGGAIALVRPRAPLRRRTALVAPLGFVLLPLAAAAWGVYAAYAGSDLALGAPPVAPLLRLAEVVMVPPWDRPLVLLVAGALLALWVGTAAALGQRLRHHAPAGGGRRPVHAVGVLTLAGAVALSLLPLDARLLLLSALGLAASATVAPRLAGGPARARLAGALAGAAVFVALVAAARWWPAAPVVAEAPALLAAPLAVAVAWVAGGRRG
jgi:hypothetical protein